MFTELVSISEIHQLLFLLTKSMKKVVLNIVRYVNLPWSTCWVPGRTRRSKMHSCKSMLSLSLAIIVLGPICWFQCKSIRICIRTIGSPGRNWLPSPSHTDSTSLPHQAWQAAGAWWTNSCQTQSDEDCNSMAADAGPYLRWWWAVSPYSISIHKIQFVIWFIVLICHMSGVDVTGLTCIYS